jgi:hypothetical protein
MRGFTWTQYGTENIDMVWNLIGKLRKFVYSQEAYQLLTLFYDRNFTGNDKYKRVSTRDYNSLTDLESECEVCSAYPAYMPDNNGENIMRLYSSLFTLWYGFMHDGRYLTISFSDIDGPCRPVPQELIRKSRQIIIGTTNLADRTGFCWTVDSQLFTAGMKLVTEVNKSEIDIIIDIIKSCTPPQQLNIQEELSINQDALNGAFESSTPLLDEFDFDFDMPWTNGM